MICCTTCRFWQIIYSPFYLFIYFHGTKFLLAAKDRKGENHPPLKIILQFYLLKSNRQENAFKKLALVNSACGWTALTRKWARYPIFHLCKGLMSKEITRWINLTFSSVTLKAGRFLVHVCTKWSLLFLRLPKLQQLSLLILPPCEEGCAYF